MRMRTLDIVRVIVAVSQLAVAQTVAPPRQTVLVASIEPPLSYLPTGNDTITPDNPQNPQQGWNVSDTMLDWDDASLWSTDLKGHYPFHTQRGNTLHTTSYSGATVSLDWVGPEIYFWGYLRGNATFTIDEQEMSLASPEERDWYDEHPELSPGNGRLIAFATGLPQTKHTATLTLVSGSIDIAGAAYIQQTSPSNESSSIQYVKHYLLDGLNNFNQEFYNNSGAGWEARTTSLCDMTGEGGTISDRHCMASQRMSTNVSLAFITTRTPPNATGAALFGTTGFDHGRFFLRVTPDLPFGADSFFTSTSKSPLFSTDVYMWTAVLDPTVVYEIKVSNVDQDSYMELNSFQFRLNVVNTSDTPSAAITSPLSTGSGTSLNVGAIAGGVVGGVVGVIILVLALWFCMRRKGERRRTPPNEDKFEVEELQDMTTVSPFPAAAANSRSDRLSTQNNTTYQPVSYVETKSPGATHLADTAPSVAPDDAPLDMNAMHPPSKALEAAAAVPAREAPHPQRPTAAATYPPSSTTNSPTTPWPQSVNRPETIPESLASPQDVGFSYERDAGRLRPMVNVPPSYDPRWADEPDEPESEHPTPATVAVPP